MSAHLELRDLLGPYVIGALGPEEKRQVEEHLGGCSSCKDEVRDLRLAHEHLTELANTEQTPPQDLKSRVLGVPHVSRRAGLRSPRPRPSSARSRCSARCTRPGYSRRTRSPRQTSKPPPSHPEQGASCACMKRTPMLRPSWRCEGCPGRGPTSTTSCGSEKRVAASARAPSRSTKGARRPFT